MSSMVKWQINHASESNRFKCVSLENRGSCKFALHININKGHHNDGGKGECRDFEGICMCVGIQPFASCAEFLDICAPKSIIEAMAV